MAAKNPNQSGRHNNGKTIIPEQTCTYGVQRNAHNKNTNGTMMVGNNTKKSITRMVQLLATWLCFWRFSSTILWNSFSPAAIRRFTISKVVSLMLQQKTRKVDSCQPRQKFLMKSTTSHCVPLSFYAQETNNLHYSSTIWASVVSMSCKTKFCTVILKRGSIILDFSDFLCQIWLMHFQITTICSSIPRSKKTRSSSVSHEPRHHIEGFSKSIYQKIKKGMKVNLLFGRVFNALGTKPLYKPITPSRCTIPASTRAHYIWTISLQNKLQNAINNMRKFWLDWDM